jgi:hypothetical protein
MDDGVAPLLASACPSPSELQSSSPPAKRVRTSGGDEGKDDEPQGGGGEDEPQGAQVHGLDSLHPVRLVLHSFITDCDMYRILD